MKENIYNLFQAIDNAPDIDQDEKLKYKKEVLTLINELISEIPNFC